MEFLKDYDFTIQYHPHKANVVAHALSRKYNGLLAHILIHEWKILADTVECNPISKSNIQGAIIANLH